MREDINFDELIDKIDFILNSSKPLPHYMKEERELAELVKHLKEIPKYETLKQFELLFDVDPFLMHFLAGTDFTKLLKIIDRTTMKYKHLDGYTPLMMIVVNPNITNFEKTVVIDRLIEMGCDVNRPNDFGETALMMAVKRNNRKMMEYLLENGASPNISDNLGVTPLMIATFNSQLYNMAVLRFFNAQLGATCSSYEFDVFDIAEITKISNTMEVLKDFQRH
ncbi:MAG: ankyrin repeat domain-containing protein [Alphaproteobacteria bacterium]|jgi:ankyrin repeat protein|nr:ankyrin repeat domain-containing protein [Alphaproteobacteria bacterium]